MMVRATAMVLVGIASLQIRAQHAHIQHFTLTTDQVTRALAKTFEDRGIQPEDAKVSLPVSVITKDPNPTLDVSSIEALGHIATAHSGEVSAAVKLTCHQHNACLPFYAIVTLPAGVELTNKAAQAASNGTQIAKTKAEIVMKAGTPATLIMDSSAAHIQLSVISMQSGSVGQRIRVSIPDHKQTYLAEVVSANLLKGAF